MGMYTEFVLGVALAEDTPKEIVMALAYMCGEKVEHYVPPNHDLFDTECWRTMLLTDSFYFDGITNSFFKRDEDTGEYYLTVRCNFKNYDNEVNHFMDFIRPYLNTKGFLGYYRYEEYEDPTFIYNISGKIKYRNF